jgi:peptide/nickel transport system substrate-binding protein
MDNVSCRAAVAAVLDRRALQGTLGGLQDALRSSRLWPRVVSGGPKDSDPRPDLPAARAALKKCGHPDGFSTVLAVVDVKGSVDLAAEVADELAKIGIKATIEALDASTFYATDVGSPKNVAARGYGIVLATWTADFPTPGSFLSPLVDGRSVRLVGNTNYARLNDKALNALIDKARAAGDTPTGRALWRDVAQKAATTSTYVPLAESRVQLVAGQRLHNGLVMRPYLGYDLATVGIR